MVKHHQNIRGECQLAIGTPVVIAKLDLGHTAVDSFYDSSQLTPHQAMLGQIHQHGDNIEQGNAVGSGQGA
jgi:hypothetical protein